MTATTKVLAIPSVNQPRNTVSIIAPAAEGRPGALFGIPVCVAPLPAPATILCLLASGTPPSAWTPSAVGYNRGRPGALPGGALSDLAAGRQ